jgi:glucan phosphoethanolaminetransferase (alkaline phosphatase superfamily)
MSQKNAIAVVIPAAQLTVITGLITQLRTAIAPYIHALTADEIKGIAKMGDKTVAFVDKVKDYMLCDIFERQKTEQKKLIKMNKLKLAYLLLFLSIILLVINIYNLDFNNLQNGNYWGIISNLLLMVGMFINIKELGKIEKNK